LDVVHHPDVGFPLPSPSESSIQSSPTSTPINKDWVGEDGRRRKRKTELFSNKSL